MTKFDKLREFFARQVPLMERTARLHFRFIPNADAREEAVQNTLGLTWKAFRGLILRNRAEEPGMLRACLKFSVKQTRAKRSPQGCPRVKDVLHQRQIGKAKFEDFDLGQFVSRSTPVFEEVRFRIDVPAWLDTLSKKLRKMAVDLAGGMSTTDAAKKHHLSMGRISQYRRLFKKLFDEFYAD